MNSYERVYCCLNCAHLDDETYLCMNNEKKFIEVKINTNIECDGYMYLPGSDAEEHPLAGLQEIDVMSWLKQNVRRFKSE